MPKGLRGFQKGHSKFKGVEKGWFKKGFTPHNKGIPHTEEFKKNMSLIKRGCKGSFGMLGKKWTPEHRKKIVEYWKNNRPANWIDDRSLVKNKFQGRDNLAYRNWRLSVYKRDKYKCRINNGGCCGRIIAHHILSFTYYPELRYEINNGITLCLAHHPHKRAEEKRLAPTFQELVSVSN